MSEFSLAKVMNKELDETMNSINSQIVKIRSILDKSSNLLIQLEDIQSPKNTKNKIIQKPQFRFNGETEIELVNIVQKFGKLSKLIESKTPTNTCNDFPNYKTHIENKSEYLSKVFRRFSAINDSVKFLSENSGSDVWDSTEDDSDGTDLQTATDNSST